MGRPEASAVPRNRRTVEIFLSLGASAGLLATAVSAAPPPARAQAQAMHPHGGGPMHPQAGEGGEGGEGGAATADSDLDLLVVLAQMQGHLEIAADLLGQRQFSAAEPHVGHPVDELYGALEPAIGQGRLSPFREPLEALRQQVRIDPASPSTPARLEGARQAIEAAAARLPQAGRADPRTTEAVVRRLAESAVSEYGAAVAGGRVVEVIDYQDGRGFLSEAQRLLDTALSAGPGTAAEPAERQRLLALQEGIRAMRKAFPTSMPPTRTLLSPEELKQLQERL